MGHLLSGRFCSAEVFVVTLDNYDFKSLFTVLLLGRITLQGDC